jgi:putative tricarboxylic transport membrane protein
MEGIEGILYGFGIALKPINLLYCLFGVSIGTLVGVLPGLGPVAAISILLPTTFHASPESGFIMLAGIYYGAMYGGSTTSILVNIPGEAASVVTCLDGYQMARQGRAGPALGISALGSFIGGTLSLIGLTLAAPPLARMALRFGPPEYFSLMILGLTILSYLTGGSMMKALMMAALGILLGCVGMDTITGVNRFTYGIPQLIDGVGIVPIVMGLFGISEIFLNVEQSLTREIFAKKVRNLLPNLQDWKKSIGAIFRGSILGFFLGILPGGGTIVASFASYALEKKVSKHPDQFGKGAIEGVAGPETANNAATGGAFIPLLTLGIPSNAVMAVLLGALMVHGLQTGPLLLKEAPNIFWGTITSMYIGNVLLVVLNLPLIGLWVKLLRIPYALLFPMIIIFCLIGAYSLNNSIVDVLVMICFGMVGYFMKKFRYEGAPLVLALVLGPMLENALRQSLILSNGSFGIFFLRPLSAGLLLLSFFLLLSPVVLKRRPTAGLKDEA